MLRWVVDLQQVGLVLECGLIDSNEEVRSPEVTVMFLDLVLGNKVAAERLPGGLGHDAMVLVDVPSVGGPSTKSIGRPLTDSSKSFTAVDADGSHPSGRSPTIISMLAAAAENAAALARTSAARWARRRIPVKPVPTVPRPPMAVGRCRTRPGGPGRP